MHRRCRNVLRDPFNVPIEGLPFNWMTCQSQRRYFTMHSAFGIPRRLPNPYLGFSIEIVTGYLT